jgi:mannose-6-phosphate isomerase-like protein (cupin superfamily)
MYSKVAKLGVWLACVVAAYLIIGIIFSRFIFPANAVDLADYFTPGDRFGSRAEGFHQTVLGVNGGYLHTRLEIMPHAAGPPEHVHESFEEKFTVKEGRVSFLVGGEKKVLGSGESMTIPPMTPHKPFNETDQIAVVQSDEDVRSLPIQFGYYLSQMYPIMDKEGGNLDMILQLSAFGNGMDSWLAGGLPIAIQKAMRVGLEPTARLLGYNSYYPEHRPRR